MQGIAQNGKIKVLVVDDSLFYRTAISNHLRNHPKIEVVGTAENPYEARDKILTLKPDVMTLDVEMPRMNGIEFLKILMPQRPMPVVVVSSVDGIVFEALSAGAVDFVEKPSAAHRENMDEFAREVAEKVIVASKARLKSVQKSVPLVTRGQENIERRGNFRTYGLIALGASTGGTEATSLFLKNLPASIPGMVVTQHMPPVFTKMYAQRLDKECALSVKEAEENDVIKPGHVYIAPGDRHLTVIKTGTVMKIHLEQGPKVNGHCPSVDVMFRSVAKFADKDTVGIIMTGMGSDGAQGMLEMKNKGAYTIGQDQASCVVYGMPMVAYKMGAVTVQSPLADISEVLINYLRKK